MNYDLSHHLLQLCHHPLHDGVVVEEVSAVNFRDAVLEVDETGHDLDTEGIDGAAVGDLHEGQVLLVQLLVDLRGEENNFLIQLVILNKTFSK